jgi:hypothetical protein
MPMPSAPWIAAVLGSFVVAVALGAPPQEPGRDPAQLRRAQQVAAVGPEHQRLAKLVGDWDVAWTNEGRDGQARDARGTATGKLVLGGRYVQLDCKLQVQGTWLHGMQLFGFDALRQQYTSSWRDDLSTWAVDCAGPPPKEQPDLLELSGMLSDVHDPIGRAFRLRLDLRQDGVVLVELQDTLEGRDHVLQRQRWTRR